MCLRLCLLLRRPGAPTWRACRQRTPGGSGLAAPAQLQQWRQQAAGPASQRGQRQRVRAVDPDVLTDPDVPLSRLQQLLDDAIDREEYTDAARIRDALQ